MSQQQITTEFQKDVLCQIIGRGHSVTGRVAFGVSDFRGGAFFRAPKRGEARIAARSRHHE